MSNASQGGGQVIPYICVYISPLCFAGYLLPKHLKSCEIMTRIPDRNANKEQGLKNRRGTVEVKNQEKVNHHETLYSKWCTQKELNL